MDQSTRSAAQAFDVYLRLRPALTPNQERFLSVESSDPSKTPQFVTIQPPENDVRKRAVEQFAFTKIFEEDASQLDLFQGTGIVSLVSGVLAADSRPRDGLLATLGVTGSGKSHTILGSKSQRGLTQLALDCLFSSIAHNIVHPTCANTVFPSLAASDVSEAQMLPAHTFLDTLYGDAGSVRGSCSRAQTPMLVGSPTYSSNVHMQRNLGEDGKLLYPDLADQTRDAEHTRHVPTSPFQKHVSHPLKALLKPTVASLKRGVNVVKDASYMSVPQGGRHRMPRVSALPQSPSVDGFQVPIDPSAEYVLVVSMYEVYNDRIFDLLGGSSGNKIGPVRRRALLFKSTEMSPDRKVVAGLKKIVCCSLEEALLVLETGLTERRVAGTGANAVSSRSHGFFCMEVKKRNRMDKGRWESSTLTIVDLAGSERARTAKTAGATLAEAGKINESLMYLGQCMQMLSDRHDGSARTVLPFRQCKLTELLFSNSFPAPHHHHYHHRPQKAIMVVTADACGDFNATSQILRYSALAREVCVPRIPSVTSQILQGLPATRPGTRDGHSPTGMMEELESRDREIARLTEEVEVVRYELAEERERHDAAVTGWAASEERMAAMESEIREQVYEELVLEFEKEKALWKEAMEEQREVVEEKMDKKIDIVTRGWEVYEDETKTNGTVEEKLNEAEAENRRLLAKIEALEREKLSRTPTMVQKKQRVLRTKRWEVENESESP